MHWRNAQVDRHIVEKGREPKMDQQSLDWDVSHEAKPDEKAKNFHQIDLAELVEEC